MSVKIKELTVYLRLLLRYCKISPTFWSQNIYHYAHFWTVSQSTIQVYILSKYYLPFNKSALESLYSHTSLVLSLCLFGGKGGMSVMWSNCGLRDQVISPEINENKESPLGSASVTISNCIHILESTVYYQQGRKQPWLLLTN